MLQVVLFALLSSVFLSAKAQDLPANVIFRQGQEAVTLDEALSNVSPGQIVVLGEEHGTEVMPRQQLQVLETLRKNGLNVSLGMEFFYYPNQPEVDAWRQGQLSEEDFLKEIAWGSGFPFSSYREQALFPHVGSEYVIALNAPRELTSAISKKGVSGLSEEEKALMPPQFTLGNDSYFKRFKDLMLSSGHVPSEEQIQNFFAAQSTWDDTMAWKAQDFLSQHPEQVLVIIVGEFHVQYGGGLPDRLRARGQKVTTFSLVNLDSMSEAEQREAVGPSSDYGSRADFVWTSRFSRP